jgi:hypothetical protein
VKLFKAIFLLMLVVGVVSTATVGLLVLSDTRELLTRDAQELSGERVKQLRLKTERALEEPVRAVLQLSRTAGFFQLPLSEQRALVTSVLTQRRDVTAITAFNAQGARVSGLQAFAFNDVPPTEVAEHEARARALLEGLSTLGYAAPVARAGRPPTVTVAFPVGEPVRGFIAAELSLASLAATVADRAAWWPGRGGALSPGQTSRPARRWPACWPPWPKSRTRSSSGWATLAPAMSGWWGRTPRWPGPVGPW